MEIRQNVTRVQKQPAMLLLAVLFALALALLGWRLLVIGAVPPTNTNYGPTVTTNSQAPDAQDRNARIRIDQIKEDATHGH